MELLADLAEVVGAAHVVTDAAARASYEVDWTRRYRATCRAVVRPGSTAEVAAVLAACTGRGVPVTLQGGNTGLVGGSVPAGDDVLVSLARLDGLGVVDPVAGQVTAGAGVTLAALHAAADAAGLAFGVDLAARDSATVGGMIATNAGGVRVIRHGPMRAQVVGVEAVTAEGAVLGDVRGLEKDNTGYHLPSLLAGSEGTLAAITRARVRLVPADPFAVVALLGLADVAAAVAVVGRLRRRVAGLSAAELVLADGVDLVVDRAGVPPPFATRHGAVLLVECAGPTDPTDVLADALADAPEVRETAVAADAEGRRRLWAVRERHTEAIATLGVPHKLDVSVPVAALPELHARAVEICRRADARLVAFGHVGEGNLHCNVLGPAPDDLRVDDALLELVHALGGSISAEHGIGRAKVGWMERIHPPAQLEALRRVKAAFDPAALLNPGVLLPPTAR